jgi:hypothetical protein
MAVANGSLAQPTLPLARASQRLRAGLPVPSRRPPSPSTLSYYARHRQAILDRQRAAYKADPTRQRAAVRASQAKRDRAIFQTGIMLGRLAQFASSLSAGDRPAYSTTAQVP